MSSRLCAYKDCNNFYYRSDNTSCSDVTLFAFPKDPKRAEQWRILGQVHPKIGLKQQYMCSKHFDPKYLSTNKNRRILLGEALPYPYEEPDKTEAFDIESPQQMSATSSTAQQNYYINSTVNQKKRDSENAMDTAHSCSSSQQNFYISMDEDELSIDKVVVVESTTTTKSMESETDLFDKIELSFVPPPKKRMLSSTSAQVEFEVQSEIEDDQLIDSSEVSMFQFKGEQYVQMSREYYLQEKRQLMQQLRSYKRALANIKMELRPFKDL